MRCGAAKQLPMEEQPILPFLNWAGGKRWLVQHAADLVPEFSGTYFEPFLGSGAMYFHLAPSRAVLSDRNVELIDAYRAVQQNWKGVFEKLRLHHRRHDKEYYYQIRSSKPRTLHNQAAKFIYLNRTCWNGLYRVNLKGEFNVPIGTKKNVVLPTDNFELTSRKLKKTELLSEDFEVVIRRAGKDDFIFVDPPYTVKHNHNGFVKYNEKLFSWGDQERLKCCIDRAVSRGAKVLVTNADHESVRELYQGYEQIQMDRINVLSGKAEYRGRYEELIVICGY